jgi:hypothetical protein
MKASNCPQCGGPITFLWSGAVQTTCPYCRSILVRHDVDLERVGEVGDVPDDASPIQIGTAGRHENRTFTVVGRIMYEYERGGWNEWHLVFNDGASGWLSDAQLEYALSFLATKTVALPAAENVQRKRQFHWPEGEFVVTSVTRAHYVGVQGELPFTYWDKSDVVFADLGSADGRFATIDYSESPPLRYVGAFVDFPSLGLANLREFEGW